MNDNDLYNRYIEKVKKEIKAFKRLINSKNPKLGNGLEYRCAIIWGILEEFLFGAIDDDLYIELHNEWYTTVKLVYKNDILCIN